MLAMTAHTPADLEQAFRRVTSAPRRVVKNRPTNFPGIMSFTRQQGLERTHVYRVLTGERHSPRLMAEWETFQSRSGLGAPTAA